jgi:hypothetical protein
VWIDAPPDQSWTNAQTVTVSGHVEDASPILEVTVGDVTATLTATPTGATFAAAGVPVGTGTIEARARDAAENPGEATIGLKVDRNPPVVEIQTPEADAWVLGPGVEVTGTAYDPEGSRVIVRVGDVEAQFSPLDPRKFRAVVPATAEGALILVATAWDEAGNDTSTPSRSVKVDFTKPVITLTDPASPPITNATVLHVEGTVEDLSPTTLKIDGTPVAVGADGGFSADVPLAGEGVRTIPFEATDKVNLVGTPSRPSR